MHGKRMEIKKNKKNSAEKPQKLRKKPKTKK
jgi:hypothetical protein